MCRPIRGWAKVLMISALLAGIAFMEHQRIGRLLAGDTVEFSGKPMTNQDVYSSGVKITAKLSAEDFVPDGNLAKPVWEQTEWAEFDHDMSGQKRFPEALTRVAAAWTPARGPRLSHPKHSTSSPKRWPMGPSEVSTSDTGFPNA